MIDLANINIILTGATGVIGNSILDKLISAGSNVLATGSNEEKLKKIQDKYKKLNTLRFDISEHQNIDKFALISVYDKANLKLICKNLQKYNIGIISTGSTFKKIKSFGYKCFDTCAVFPYAYHCFRTIKVITK